MSNGYGRLYPPGMKGKSMLAHRWVWEQANGPIPPGLFVLHRCDNPPCVEITHLFLGTAADNSADMKAKKRSRPFTEHQTHCAKGHPFDDENTEWSTRNGYRVRRCRACNRERARRGYVPHPAPPITHCPHGHPYDDANTYVNTKGRKVCRICKNQRGRIRYVSTRG